MAQGSLQPNLREAVEKGFAELSRQPAKGKILRGHKGVRSLPVTTPGDEYRIVYTLKPEDRVVLVILVGPREGFYERRLGRMLRIRDKNAAKACRFQEFPPPATPSPCVTADINAYSGWTQLWGVQLSAIDLS